MMPIRIVVPGTPQQQGSKTRMPNGHMIEANKKLPSWRVDAITAAQNAYQGPKLVEPLSVSAVFYFARPKSHYGTGRNAGVLKPSAPEFYAQTPDLDKLLRAVGDVLTQAGVIQDDRLICFWWDTEKCWTDDAPRTEITVDLAREAAG